MTTIVIETGEIIAGANSFVSIDEYRQYFSSIGIDTSEYDDETVSQQLVSAFYSMNALYWGRLQGLKVSSFQEGMFPRQGMLDLETNASFDSNTIPINVKKWQIEATRILLTNGGYQVLEPVLDKIGVVKAYTSTVDVITESVTFADSGGRFDTQIFTRLENLMRPFLKMASIIDMPIVRR